MELLRIAEILIDRPLLTSLLTFCVFMIILLIVSIANGDNDD